MKPSRGAAGSMGKSETGGIDVRKRRFVEQRSGEEYIHKLVWRVVERQLAHAKAQPSGSLYDHLVAMVFASHALEGYLNFLGEKVSPTLWADERVRFAKTGVGGKLEALHTVCGLPQPQKGKRPYATVRELKRLRDSIAHPRTQRTERETEYAEGHEPSMFPKGYLEGLVTPDKAARAVEDVRAIADTLHAAARLRFHDRSLGTDALTGMLGFASSSSRLKE